MKFSVQSKVNGQMIELCDTIEQIKAWKKAYPDIEVISVENASCVEVCYVEYSGPSGYGCNTPEFTTYGSIKNCISYLYKWMQASARIFGPDAREVKDFFRHCHLYVNKENKSSWLWKQADKIDLNTLYL